MAEIISEFKDNCMIVRIKQETVNKRGSVYEAVRHSWRANIYRAKKATYVLAVINGMVKGVFEPEEWYKQWHEKRHECENCKRRLNRCDRIGFTGRIAENEAQIKYNNKIVSSDFLKGRNPIIYTYDY
jgi:hypothetical protein